ncbi:MAG TPA: hypothetical protein VIL69_23060 [Roseomonas sp.]
MSIAMQAEPTYGLSGLCQVQLRLSNNLAAYSMIETFSGEIEVNNGGSSFIRNFNFRLVERWGSRNDTVLAPGQCDASLSLRVMSVSNCQIDGRRYRDCADLLNVSEPLSVRIGLVERLPPANREPSLSVMVIGVTTDHDGYPVARVVLETTHRSALQSVTLECAFLNDAGQIVSKYYALRSVNLTGERTASLDIRGQPAGVASRAECKTSG